MTKIDIVSGFLGAGKTTLIKKLLAEAYKGEQLVLIENEFGEINIDGGFLKESGIQISEMSAGCICCSLVGDFNKALRRYGRKSRARALDPHPAVRLCGGVAAAGEDKRRVGTIKIRKADKFIYKHEYYPFLQKFRGTAVRTPAIIVMI